MRFQKGKPFVVVQITDTQEGASVAKDTLRLIEAALDRVQPDLVVYTGDQIKAYDRGFLFGDVKGKVSATIRKLVEPAAKRGIAFAPTFGNHDPMKAISKKEQMQVYRSFATCVAPSADDDSCGDYIVPVRASESEDVVLNFYLIDSNKDRKGGGYEPVRADQIDWYRKQREILKVENGDYVPSVVFQHIPVQEYYEILKAVPKGTKDAVKAYRLHRGTWFVTDDEKVWQKEFFLETPAAPDENTGQFAAMQECGDVMGMYVGHDHKCSFVGTHEGIDLGYTPGAGFHTYGPGIRRAVRVFEFEEENPRAYKTYTLSFKELVGKKVSRPLANFYQEHSPSSVDQAVSLIVKLLGILGGIGLVIWLLLYLL